MSCGRQLACRTADLRPRQPEGEPSVCEHDMKLPVFLLADLAKAQLAQALARWTLYKLRGACLRLSHGSRIEFQAPTLECVSVAVTSTCRSPLAMPTLPESREMLNLLLMKVLCLILVEDS